MSSTTTTPPIRSQPQWYVSTTRNRTSASSAPTTAATCSLQNASTHTRTGTGDGTMLTASARKEWSNGWFYEWDLNWRHLGVCLEISIGYEHWDIVHGNGWSDYSIDVQLGPLYV